MRKRDTRAYHGPGSDGGKKKQAGKSAEGDSDSAFGTIRSGEMRHNSFTRMKLNHDIKGFQKGRKLDRTRLNR
jgi:hypothetical protein